VDSSIDIDNIVFNRCSCGAALRLWLLAFRRIRDNYSYLDYNFADQGVKMNKIKITYKLCGTPLITWCYENYLPAKYDTEWVGDLYWVQTTLPSQTLWI
jgi:hypothetical protein